MIPTMIGLCVAVAAGFGAGWYCGEDAGRRRHNVKIERMADQTRRILEDNAERQRAKLEALRARVAALARLCGVDLPAEGGMRDR